MVSKIVVGVPVVAGPLAVYPLRRDGGGGGPHVLTLHEALAGGDAIVHELGRVEQVALEARGDVPVFALGGDCVRGALQDRVVVRDMLAMPGFGPIRAATFCVEEGRWRKRAGESAAHFGSSTHAAPSSLRRLLVKRASQSDVWHYVRETQRYLSGTSTAGPSVRDARSRSSLALTMDVPELGRDLAELVEPMHGVGGGDVVGHAVAIGGKLSHAELFATADLHGRLWPRLVEASAIDALGQPIEVEPPAPDDVMSWLEAAFALPAASASPAGAAWHITRRPDLRSPLDLTCMETVWGDPAAPLHVLVMAG